MHLLKMGVFAHTHTGMAVYMLMHVNMEVYTCKHMYMHMFKHMHATPTTRTQGQKYTSMCMHECILLCMCVSRVHVLKTHIKSHTCTHMDTDMHTCCTHAPAHAHEQCSAPGGPGARQGGPGVSGEAGCPPGMCTIRQWQR